MAVLLKNNAVSRLAASITTGATSLSVTAGDGAKFPAPGAGDWFPLTLVKADGSLEILRCTARSGDVLTVTRAQEGTAALAFTSGDRAELRITAAALNTVLGGSGSYPQFGGIELVSAGPYVDFHYGSSTADFTSRIISDAESQLLISSASGGSQARFTDNAFTSYKQILAPGGFTCQNGSIRVRNGTGGEFADFTSTGVVATYNAASALLSSGVIWHTGNFVPATKITGDTCNTAGLSGGTAPYMRRSSDNAVIYLQTNLGYTPVQQFNGNAVKLGYNSTYGRVELVVDASYFGFITTDDRIMPIIAAQGTGGVGTYAFLGRIGGVGANPGDLAAGSSLAYSSVNSATGGSPGGTWRCMGLANSGASTVWLRVS